MPGVSNVSPSVMYPLSNAPPIAVIYGVRPWFVHATVVPLAISNGFGPWSKSRLTTATSAGEAITIEMVVDPSLLSCSQATPLEREPLRSARPTWTWAELGSTLSSPCRSLWTQGHRHVPGR